MTNIIDFYNNRHTLQINQFDFDARIKLIFTDIFSSRIPCGEHNKFVEIIIKHHPRCLICLMRRFVDYHAGICPLCIDKMWGIYGCRYIGYNSNGNYVEFGLSQQHQIVCFQPAYIDKFINNLHKLKDEFFHNGTIIFIMAICDRGSPIHILNNDIVMYMFQFIY